MDEILNKIKEVAERSRLELLGYLHQAAEELNAEAREKNLFVKHSFDFEGRGEVFFWIAIRTHRLDDIFGESTSFINLERVNEILCEAHNLITNYKEGE